MNIASAHYHKWSALDCAMLTDAMCYFGSSNVNVIRSNYFPNLTYDQVKAKIVKLKITSESHADVIAKLQGNGADVDERYLI